MPPLTTTLEEIELVVEVLAASIRVVGEQDQR
jgi:hypothetical protein